MTTVTTDHAKGTSDQVDASGRIRELWDLGQEVPADSPNEAGPF